MGFFCCSRSSRSDFTVRSGSSQGALRLGYDTLFIFRGCGLCLLSQVFLWAWASQGCYIYQLVCGGPFEVFHSSLMVLLRLRLVIFID